MPNWTPQQFRAYALRRLASEERARADMRTQHESTPLAGLSDTECQPDSRSTLDQSLSGEKASPPSLGYRVTIISMRQKPLDLDNLIAGAKFLRDNIAETIGLDDAEDSGIQWEYSQVITKGEQGTIVKIETLLT